ncbi:MAG: hypothetical protein IJ553_00005, partial [Alloprevotella sp.]|nr:hypothetical protein [Alloprevotella sp.]
DSENAVNDMPKQFNDWIEEHREQIELSRLRGNEPYFLRDNTGRVNTVLGISQSQPMPIKFGATGVYNGVKLGREATKEAMRLLEEHEEMHNYSEEQEENFKDITKETGYERGKPMTFAEADNGNSNTFKDKDNCAACVLTHELRLRGYDITALPYGSDISVALSENTRIAWMTPTKKMPEWTAKIGGTEDEIISKIEKATKPIGSRYHLGWDSNLDRGHIITIERTKNGLLFYDPQKDDYYKLSDIIKKMKPDSKLELLRVDKLLVRPQLLNALTQSRK